MELVLTSLCSSFLTQHMITCISSSRLLLHSIVFYYINDLLKDELKPLTQSVTHKRNIMDQLKN